MLFMMISSPRQLENDMDVYLSPLVEDLRMLWDKGVDAFDRNNNPNFKIRSMLFYTINDFLTYGNLFGYSVKGHKTCPICEESTSYHQLTHERKTCYLGHRKFLKVNHTYRRLKKGFNECQENDVPPMALTRDEAMRKTYGKNGQSSLIYHTSISLM
ncbi:hypothetical protein CR513_39662, partial [Mucuna pruriens]